MAPRFISVALVTSSPPLLCIRHRLFPFLPMDQSHSGKRRASNSTPIPRSLKRHKSSTIEPLQGPPVEHKQPHIPGTASAVSISAQESRSESPLDDMDALDGLSKPTDVDSQETVLYATEEALGIVLSKLLDDRGIPCYPRYLFRGNSIPDTDRGTG